MGLSGYQILSPKLSRGLQKTLVTHSTCKLVLIEKRAPLLERGFKTSGSYSHSNEIEGHQNLLFNHSCHQILANEVDSSKLEKFTMATIVGLYCSK
jgi:hypothetical protein